MNGFSPRLGLLAAATLVVAVPVGSGRAQEAGPAETAQLRRQVSYLAEALAKSKAEADALKARLDGRVAGERGLMPVPGGGRALEILDVNSDLGMVILG